LVFSVPFLPEAHEAPAVRHLRSAPKGAPLAGAPGCATLSVPSRWSTSPGGAPCLSRMNRPSWSCRSCAQARPSAQRAATALCAPICATFASKTAPLFLPLRAPILRGWPLAGWLGTSSLLADGEQPGFFPCSPAPASPRNVANVVFARSDAAKRLFRRAWCAAPRPVCYQWQHQRATAASSERHSAPHEV